MHQEKNSSNREKPIFKDKEKIKKILLKWMSKTERQEFSLEILFSRKFFILNNSLV